MDIQLVDTVEVANELGEGVIWDAATQRIMWTDIVGQLLFSYCPLSKSLDTWSTPERLCCFAPTAEPGRLVVAFESGFAFYTPDRDHVQWIQKLEQDNPGTRFNDGRTDRQGRLWSATMVENQETATYQGSLYCLDATLTVRKTLSGLSIPNSLCWSPDAKLMYHCDTPSRQIFRYAFDPETGHIGEASIFVTTDKNSYPDGSIVDAQGHLWNAQWGGKKVVRYSPNGEVDFELPIPCTQPSCVAFGGPELDLLVVTSAWQDMDDEARLKDTQAGHLFIYQTPFQGIEESSFIEQ